ncbi:MAG: hypothetical protein ABI480_11640 [Chitinophagaceae bacterium]
MKKKVLIVTLNDYVIYQPTILSLYDFLSPDFDVTIISFQPKFATKQKDTTRNIVYLKTGLRGLFFQRFDFLFSYFAKFRKLFSKDYVYYHQYYHHYLPSVLKGELKRQKGKNDIIIAVDFPALYEAQKIFGAVHFLSLEIDNNTSRYYKLVDPAKVKSVAVQSKERYNYLFPGQQLKTFIIPNSPIYIPVDRTKNERKDFIWAGAIDRRLAVMECIAFFDRYPQYKLIMKGGGDEKTQRLINEKYGELLTAGRIVIDRKYLAQESFIDFLATFRIGFCFYAWDLIAASFNYQSAPSGKLLMYMAAGTPVIACDIPGFQFIKESGAGVLVKDYEPETILNAIQTIEANYQQYSDACLRIAGELSFDKNVAPYIEFLKQQ